MIYVTFFNWYQLAFVMLYTCQRDVITQIHPNSNPNHKKVLNLISRILTLIFYINKFRIGSYFENYTLGLEFLAGGDDPNQVALKR